MISGELNRFGLSPGDIRTVIFTHLHFDHAGGASQELAVAVKQDRVRLGLRIYVDADHSTAVVRSMLNLKRTAAHTKPRICGKYKTRGEARAPSCHGVSFSLRV